MFFRRGRTLLLPGACEPRPCVIRRHLVMLSRQFWSGRPLGSWAEQAGLETGLILIGAQPAPKLSYRRHDKWSNGRNGRPHLPLCQ